MGDLTIVLVGENSITKKDDNDIMYSHGIYFNDKEKTLTVQVFMRKMAQSLMVAPSRETGTLEVLIQAS